MALFYCQTTQNFLKFKGFPATGVVITMLCVKEKQA